PLLRVNRTAPADSYTLSLHDALPIYKVDRPEARFANPQCREGIRSLQDRVPLRLEDVAGELAYLQLVFDQEDCLVAPSRVGEERSEEHTTELQSRGQTVCRLPLEQKK